jgi:hypothetical protein
MFNLGIIVVKVQKGNKVVVFNFIAQKGGFGEGKMHALIDFA